MAINFPDSPVNGEEFTVNNTVYRYNSAKDKWAAIKQIQAIEINEETVLAYSTVLGGW